MDNWNTGVRSNLSSVGLAAITTLSNGRTYALLDDSSSIKQQIVELQSTGGIRVCSTDPEFADGSAGGTGFETNGDLRSVSISGGIQIVTEQAYNGPNGSNDPTWLAATTLASAPATPTTPVYNTPSSYNLANNLALTSSNVLVSYDGDGGSYVQTHNNTFPTMHLGGISTLSGSNTSWQWQASPGALGHLSG